MGVSLVAMWTYSLYNALCSFSRTIRRLERAFNSIELDVRDARCSNESDKQKIWTEVGREESALDTLNDGIKSILWIYYGCRSLVSIYFETT